jgi:hypothetical protein
VPGPACRPGGLATREQKVALLDFLFAVSAADHSTSTAEDNAIIRICAELQLRCAEVVAARGRYRKCREVFKGMPLVSYSGFGLTR